ncbi:ABC transporter ATP-binding protein [Methanospirillum hungatei]|uniref:ABC transporter ATP-binding protein n=1 Tax=Methanospirillum hungatei TaxID=2203 RepID=UPI0026EB2952|nr:ABC transporter ATP-binding protein [Methanospirillum hungatei]MCA1917751.1 ABC transporter ATP-binding protein [Methanospirillum hungatei]
MTGQILEISDLSAGYDENDILQEISLLVREKSFVGVIGPNGSGKSTFMQVLARSLPVRDGDIILLGDPLQSYSYRDFGVKVGYVPQESDIKFKYPVYEVVMMGRNPHIERFRPPSDADHEAVRRALQQTGTLELADRPITALSGGERQRVMIARVLAQDPVLLLLDEPFAHIDIHHQYELIRIIRDASREKRAVIGVFHDINLAAAYCDDLVLMHNGRIRAYGKPEEVLTTELIHEVFRIRPVIDINPTTGTPFVYVEEDLKESDAHTLRIHLISGGGTGSYLISLLSRSGYSLSCGVLAENDSDCMMARKYGIPTLAEPPFSRLSFEMEEKLAELVLSADVVIVTSMPVGWGNYPNIRVLQQIDPKKIICILPSSEPTIPDFTGGVATDTIKKLLSNGALSISSPGELLEILQTTQIVNDYK